MSKQLKRILCVLLALTMLLSLSACRHSPVLEQTVYTADGEVDPNNQQTDNDEEHTEEDTTLPPRTTKPNVSQQSDQTRVSATKPQTNTRRQTSTSRGNSNPRQASAAPFSQSRSNTNKGTGEVPGVKEDPSSPAQAVERKAVNRADLPEDVATVAAVGDAALYVEMLGGANRLLASSASFTTNYYAQLFPDFAKVKGLWEKNGETAMSESQFQQLLSTDPEAVFYIADADSNRFQSFTEAQLAVLNQKGIYTVPLSLFNTTNNIKNNVRTIGKVLGKGSKVPGAKNANDMASEYIQWMDDILKGKERQTYSGPEKFNLDQDGVFSQTDSSYADTGYHTILIEGWDDTASTELAGQGVAYAHTGYSTRISPVSYYLSVAGVANNAVLVSDNGISRDLPVVPFVNATVYGNVNGGNKGTLYRQQSDQMTSTGGYIGSPNFNKILVDSQATKAAMENNDAWQNWGYNPYGENNQQGYGRPDGETMAFSNIHGDYEIIVNPYGIGSWTTGSPESPLEELWAEQIFLGNAGPEGAFQAIQSEVMYFYSTFYGVNLSAADLAAIRDGI
ncbi:MAG: hypothetical protein IJ230_06640 [Clostridia bacterium]|nr:hypothetical protein [Clostridia bacterium]